MAERTTKIVIAVTYGNDNKEDQWITLETDMLRLSDDGLHLTLWNGPSIYLPLIKKIDLVRKRVRV